MIVAQFAIPLSAVAALAFAFWFSLDILLRTRPSDAVAEAAEAAPARDGALLWRFVSLSLSAALLAGAAFGALAGVYREAIEMGALAGLGVVAGAFVALLTALVGAALGQRASQRAATVSDRNLRHALAITLWAGAAPALAAAAVAIAGVTGLYAAAARFAEIPHGEAAFLTMGVAAGAALVALAARLTANGGGDEKVDGSDSVLSAIVGAETFALIAAVGAAGLAIGAPFHRLSGDAVWLVAPLVVQALGLAAATFAAISLPLWARALHNAGRTVTAGYAIAAALAGAFAFALPLVVLEEGRWWFAGAALTGVALSVLLFVAASALRDPDGERKPAAGAVAAFLAAAALAGAFALGRQAEIDGIRDGSTALYGVAMAGAGALALAPAIGAVRWFGAAAADTVALAERARRAGTPPADAPAPLGLGPLAAMGQRALSLAWNHTFAWTVLAGALAGLTLLLAVRAELGRIAADDVPRYVTLVSALGVVPEFAEHEAAVALELSVYRDLLEQAGVDAPDLPELLLAGDEEARRFLRLRAEGGADAPGLRAIGGGPLPFPPLPPLRAGGEAAVGALLGLTALLGALGLAASGRLRPFVRAAGALLLVAAVPLAAAFVVQPLAGANAGWEVVAGAMFAVLIAGLALAARSVGWRGVEAGPALAIWLAAAGAALAPALLAA